MFEEHVRATFSIVAGAYQGEIDRRELTQEPVRVFEVQAARGGPTMAGGSVLVLTARRRSESFAKIVRAAESGDATLVSSEVEAFERLLSRAPAHRAAVPVEPLAGLAAIPVLSRVTYRGSIIADAMAVGEGLDMSLARLPYAGGKLDPAGFLVDRFHRRGASKEDLETVVVVRPPVLTDIERKVLERLPADLSQMTLGSPGSVANWGLLAAGVVLASVYFVGTYLAREAQRELQQQQKEQERQYENQYDPQYQQELLQEGHPQQQQQDQQQQDQQQQDRQQGQDQQQEGQQQEGQQQQDQQQNGGDLSGWVERTQLGEELAGLDARAAVTVLLQLRGQLVASGRIG